MSKQAASEYRYDHITSRMFKEHTHFSEDSFAPGDPLPDLELFAPDLTSVPLRRLARQRPLLLVLGSISCPMTAASIGSIKKLHDSFGQQVRFVMVNVREAHPGERIPQPRRLAEKLDNASELEHRYDIPFEVLSDDIDGTLHRMLGGLPNGAFLFDRHGRLAFRALWAGDDVSLRQALEAVREGRTPARRESESKLVPMAQGIGRMRETLERSGTVALRDIWREAPPMALLASVARFFSPLPPLARTAAAVASVAAASIAVSAVAIAVFNRGSPVRRGSQSRRRV